METIASPQCGVEHTSESHQISRRSDWPSSTSPYSAWGGLAIHQVFERQAAAHPDRMAAICGNERMTYGQLNERANQLAHLLRDQGIGPESIVGLYMERSARTIIAILGILKAGGCYLPIDLAYPAERIAFMLDDAKAPIVLTESHLAARLDGFGGKTIFLDAGCETIASESAENLEAPLAGENAAYVIYTSGSTGKPKGVVVTHHNVVRLFASTNHWYQFSETDVWTLFHSFAFDFSVWELWGALFFGGSVVVVPSSVARSPQRFYELLAQERVTVLNQTPSAFRQLIWAEESAPLKRPLQLRYVIFGGEALELQSLRPWLARHGDSHPLLVNMYGITETTVHVTYRPIRRKDVEAGSGSVIGEPIPDLTLHLLDDHLQPVPLGTPGEIHVGGEGLARGYLNRPELTAQRFIRDMFSQAPGARLYRSGDLARYLPNGDLEYLGRIDQQVKIRGFRIELGEIQTALNLHPAIRESLVTCDEHAGERRLIAYIVCRSEKPSVDQLRPFLGTRLPEYMVPARFVFLESFPLTINGKIDRRGLPSPESSRPDLRTRFVAPTSPEEQALAAIWAGVLGVEEIGVDDNFFELGGDSIRSIQVLAQAQQRGLHFSLQKLFQQPTIAALVQHLETGCEDHIEDENEAFALVSKEDRAKMPAGVRDAYPLTKLQHGMVFHSDYDPCSAIFHDVFSFRLKLPGEEPKLRQATARLFARHGIYRTSFDLHTFSEPLQLVHEHVDAPFSVEDLRDLDAARQKEALVCWVEREKRHRFDWGTAPLMRLHVQRHAEDTFQFIVSFHHAIMDGWSLAAMLTELFQDYARLLNGLDQAIAAPRLSYRDFVTLEQRALASGATREYREKKISNAVVHTIPRWRETPRRGGAEQVRGPEIYFPKELLARLKSLANECGLPIRSILLAAHCRVMSALTGHTDIVTGLVTNGRPQCLDGEKLIGLFLNTLPFRLQLGGGTWRDLIRDTFEVEQELIPYRRYPLSEIQQLAGGQALFETVFDFVQFHVYRDIPGYKDHDFLEDHYFEANNFNFFVTFMLDASASELQMHFDYNPNEFCEEQIGLICEYYRETLNAMVISADQRYEKHSVLPPSERQKLLVAWNDTHSEITPLCVHQLFEQQVGRTPNSPAAVFEGRTLTYRQLNAAANFLAGQLRHVGVGPDVLVGIHIERSLEMLVCVLGVLKAGGAYVPLDPAYPRGRLEFMASDAGLKAILTSRRTGPWPEISAQRLIEVDELIDRAGDGLPNLTPLNQPADLAYVIYTSGSTGKPKGVQVQHRAFVNLLTSMLREPGLQASDTLLAVTTLSFDIAGLELFLPLIAGARLVLASTSTAQDPVALARTMTNHGVTVMQATPTTWTAMVESKWPGNPHLKALCGGEPLRRELANNLLTRCAELWNMYGPTETTIWSTLQRVQAGAGPVPIGRPITNTEVYVLDACLNPVPTGSEGEIYIGGEGLARGYLNRPDLTQQRFISHPFKRDARLYRTGDLGRSADGRILCSGRIDHQVKVRGFRIELGEIEAVLEKHPSVARAVVAAREHGDAGKSLIAYWIDRGATASPDSELRAFVETQLPSYMVPFAFVRVPEFPLTPNGKIDRQRLPEPAEDRSESRTGFVAPRTPFEKELAGVWQSVLKVREVGVRDNFFQLGGNSLIAMRALGKLRSRFAADLTVASVFEHPTIEAYAVYLLEAVLKQNGVNQEEEVNI